MKLLTVAQFAEMQGIPLQTIYSWIKREQTAEHGFKVHKVGSVNLIEETKKPTKVKKAKVTQENG